MLSRLCMLSREIDDSNATASPPVEQGATFTGLGLQSTLPRLECKP